MIIVEYLGFKTSKGDIKISHITDIYNDEKKLAHLSNEFVSIAFELLKEQLNPGDQFKIKIKDKDNTTLKESIKTLAYINNGLYYEED